MIETVFLSLNPFTLRFSLMGFSDGIECLFIGWKKDQFPYKIRSASSIKVPLI